MDYQPFYCEENIWKLCEHGVNAGSQVIFISNLNREALLFEQRGGDPIHGMVAWDYHVILAEPLSSAAREHGMSGNSYGRPQDATKLATWSIRDFDTRLGNPCLWTTYRDQTFRKLPVDFAPWTPMFRPVPAELYHQRFASDRSHMRNPDGSWIRPPPSWPMIGEGSNLMSLIDFRDNSWGEVVELNELLS